MHINKYERYYMISFTIMLALFLTALIAGAVVFGVRLPTQGAFINPSRLDQTEFANPGVRDMGNNEYEVHIVAQMWSFTPSEIRVPVGARVTFNVTSADITHGFIIERHNANLELVPGHIAQTSLTFNEAGTFALQCHEYCGRGHHLMHASIIVEEEPSGESS